MGQLLLLGTVIGANNLAASMALGALGQAHLRWRIVPVFGAVEFAVPLIGLLAGRQTAQLVGQQASWLAPALLAALGAWMVWSALSSGVREEAWAARAATVRGSLLLSLGLGIDNLVVGFSFGLGGRSPFVLAGTIAVFSVVFSLVGFSVGSRLRRRREVLAEVSAGLAMLGLAAASATGLI